MNRVTTGILVGVAVCVLGTMFAGAALAAEKPERPANRVVAMYFHRTERCPTCQKMGSYAEEAVKTGFSKQIKDGSVEFHYIDFQDKKNAAYAKAYRVTGPAMIVAKVVDNKVAKISDLKDIWTKVREKKAFLKYVQDNVTALSKPDPKAAAPPQDVLTQASH